MFSMVQARSRGGAHETHRRNYVGPAGSKYDMLPRCYAERDYQIALNVAASIKSHPGSSIVALTGADRRGELLRHLILWFGDSIALQAMKD